MKSKYAILIVTLGTILSVGNGCQNVPSDTMNKDSLPKISQQKTSTEAGFTAYEDGKMKFQYPLSWQKDAHLDIFTSPSESADDYKEYFIYNYTYHYTASKKFNSIDGFSDYALTNFKDEYSANSQVIKEQKIVINGNDAKKFILKGKNDAEIGKDGAWIYYVIFGKKYAYTFVLSATPATLDKYESIFDKIVKTAEEI